MDYDSINNHMNKQEKLSLSAAATRQMADNNPQTYDEINSYMTNQQKLSMIAADLQQLVDGDPQDYSEINNTMSHQQKLSLIAAALNDLKDSPGEEKSLAIGEYDPATGKITGSGFGNTGTVYVFDRMQNKGVPAQVSSWSETGITLTTPIDTANLVGVTSLWVETPAGESNKVMVHGEQPVPGYGIVYYDDASGVVHTHAVTTLTEYNTLVAGSSAGPYKQWTFDGNTVNADQIVGFQIGEDATTTPQYFLAEMPRLNQPIDFSGLASISDYVMRSDVSFDQPVDITGVAIGSNFLYNCHKFNQPIAVETAASFGLSFLSECSAFNHPVKLPDAMTIVPALFLQNCENFNSPVDLNNATVVGSNFMQNCYVFNLLIDTSKLTSVGNYFFDSCRNFNQPIDTSSIETIGSNFMSNCRAFNQQLDLGEVTTVGSNMFSNSTDFSQPISLPKCTSIGSYFLYRATSFKARVTLGAATTVGGYFMNGVPSANTIDVGASTPPTGDYSFCPQRASNANKYFSAITQGFTLIGANAAVWKEALPDKTSYPARTIIDGTA